MRKIMASLDLGSDTIKLVVGEMIKSKLHILSAISETSRGIKRGIITNEVLVQNCLKKVISRSEEIIGIKITKIIVNIPAVNAEFLINEGICEIKNDHLIDGEDIYNVIVNSSSNCVQTNMEIINTMPTIFKIDEDKLSQNPKKMIGKSLRLKSVIATTSKTITKTIINTLNKLNIEVLDLSFGGMNDYYLIKSEEYDKKIGAIINLGEETTTISIINKGVLTNSEIIEMGGKNIEHDISFIYKINNTIAKDLKRSLALAHNRMAIASDYEYIDNNLGEKVKINQYEISEIVMSRLSEILKISKKQINHLTKKEISYIMVTGGLTELSDFQLILDEIFGKNVIVGRIEEIGARSNIYSSCIGLIKYYYDKMKLIDKDYSIFSIEEQKEFSGMYKKSLNDSSILGKLYGYFFDN